MAALFFFAANIFILFIINILIILVMYGHCRTLERSLLRSLNGS